MNTTVVWQVEKFHNNRPSTLEDYETEAQAEFAADAHFNTYHMRALVSRQERVPMVDFVNCRGE